MIELLATPWGRTAVIVIAGAAMFGIWLTSHDAKVAKQAETKIVQRSETVGKKNATAAKKAHDAARRPGSFDRLLVDSCRDCVDPKPLRELAASDRKPH